ncbi:uncharacterized protein [Aegilops tauschii subsp. strangulata]|uniref:uncharacterized protein n=1 Tax=Aegilops tauschii subsp. strangulata TaxID=200361 RepID=UPI003CC8AEE5
MDSDDEEVFAALMEEEAEADSDDKEHLMILAALDGLFANNAKPRRGGSAPGRRKSKQRHRMEGYCSLYADYFVDAPLHDEKVFQRHYRMSRKPFLRIANAIREFDSYFICKKDCTVTCSKVFAKLVEGHASPMNVEVNGRHYNKGYYLADGIYPRWPTFVKAISNPVPGGKNSYFAKCQESCRKDV